MPMFRINATPAGLKLNGSPQSAEAHLRCLQKNSGPAIIMVHGYKYHPGHARRCPHRRLFGPETNKWPAQLGFDAGQPDEGIGIGLGWYARGALKTVHARAMSLGREIAEITKTLKDADPARPVHVIAHSLGAEAALTSLQDLPANSIDRMVLLTGASYTSRALDMLDTPAGRTVEVLNVTSRENDVFDAAFEQLVPRYKRGDHAIGQGIEAPNAVNIQIDCEQTLRGVERLGFSIAPPSRRICHWSGYKRTGIMALYSTFMRTPGRLPLENLRTVLPQSTAPRWSRLVTFPKRVLPVPDSVLPLPEHRLGS